MLIMEETETFGEWLIKHRKNAGLTQEELADKLGFTKSYISNIERNAAHSVTGARPKPSVEFLKAVSEAFRLPVFEVWRAAFPEEIGEMVYAPREGAARYPGERDDTPLSAQDGARILAELNEIKRLLQGKG